jgi:hypothetical protein
MKAVETLESLLMLNPSDRPTAAQALQYNFFADAETLHDYNKNYLAPPASDFFDFEMEKNPVPVIPLTLLCYTIIYLTSNSPRC